MGPQQVCVCNLRFMESRCRQVCATGLVDFLIVDVCEEVLGVEVCRDGGGHSGRRDHSGKDEDGVDDLEE